MKLMKMVSYVPHPTPVIEHFELPKLPDLIFVDKLMIAIILFLLFIPLAWKQESPEREKFRKYLVWLLRIMIVLSALLYVLRPLL